MIKDYIKDNKKNILLCFWAVFGMGFTLSFLLLCNLGTDPYSFMNRNISGKIGLTFGTWQMSLNLLLLLIVIIVDRKLIGIGTFLNMILIGYFADFFDWVWSKTIPDSVFTESLSRGIVFVIALAIFILSAAVYMNTDVGIASYDAMAVLLARKFNKIPSFLFRNLIDFTCILIGFLIGGSPLVGHFLMAIFLGPAISSVGKLLKKGK
ncbi:MAG: hypothetical protein IJ167_05620 [Lachnospiraceae bacterium]|nr:hypothetical protein [Lachnospiraceae bacterium]